MNLPCDAVTVLMVITCVSIYAIGYCICTYILLLPTTFYIISASIYRDILYTHAVVWFMQLTYCIYVYTGVTLM